MLVLLTVHGQIGAPDRRCFDPTRCGAATSDAVVPDMSLAAVAMHRRLGLSLATRTRACGTCLVFS